MPWPDRLITPRYVSPSGVEIEFEYEDLEKSVDALTTPFTTPGRLGTYMQDVGRSGKQIPLRLFFSGPDHDLLANVFDAMLAEVGVAVLDHPMYGAGIKVVPFGKIKRSDRVTSAGNQTIFTITLFETVELLYPGRDEDPRDATTSAVEAYLNAAPEEFDEAVRRTIEDKEVPRQSLISRIIATTQSIHRVMQNVISKVAEIKAQVDRVVAAIEGAIDDLIGGPLLIAFQLMQLIQLPARVIGSIRDRIDAYVQLFDSLIGGAPEPKGPPGDPRPDNNFRSDDLAATGLLMGMVSSVLNHTFDTRSEALETADFILATCDRLQVWRDERLATLELIDTGVSFQHVQKACASVAGFLAEMSFTLRQERILTLDRARTPLDLEAEIYGTVDVNLDLLISTNRLVGSEILEIPAGFDVVYYR